MSDRVTNATLALKLDHMDEKIDGIEENVSDIHECVFGNSKPEKGLAFRVAQNEKFINGQKRWLWIIITASTGAAVASIAALIRLLAHAGATIP